MPVPVCWRVCHLWDCVDRDILNQWGEGSRGRARCRHGHHQCRGKPRTCRGKERVLHLRPLVFFLPLSLFSYRLTISGNKWGCGGQRRGLHFDSSPTEVLAFFFLLFCHPCTQKKNKWNKKKNKNTQKRKKKTSTFVWKEATFYKPLAAEKWCLFCIATNCRIELNNPYSHVNPAPPPSPKPNSLKNIKVNTNPYIFVGIWYHRRANIDMLFCIFVC